MIARALLYAMSALLVGACASTIPEHFYSLSADTSPPIATTNNAVFSMTIEKVTVPELVDRPQIVLSKSEYQVSMMEGNRWAESLRQAIPRQIAANLRRQFSRASIATGSDSTFNAQANYKLAMDVVRFESRLDESVDLAVHWRLRNAAGILVDRVSTLHEGSIGAGYDGLVAAHIKALARLSDDIAAAVLANPIGR